MPPEFAELLQSVVRDTHLKRVAYSAGAPVADVVLRERKAGMKFRVTNVPSSWTIVRMSRLQHLKGMKDGKWKQICDYLLVIPDGRESRAVLVEMKKTLSDARRAMEQLRWSVPVAKYLQSLCEVKSEESIHVVLRHVVLAEKITERFDKEPTRVTRGVRFRKDVYKGNQVKTIVGRSVAARELAD